MEWHRAPVRRAAVLALLALQVSCLDCAAAESNLAYSKVIAAYDSNDQDGFVRDLESLAADGDVRAALLMGLVRLDGRFGVRDRSEGLAWLQVAASIDDWNPDHFEPVSKAMTELEPRFSPDERAAAAVRAREILSPLERRRSERLAAARASLLDPASLPTAVSRRGAALSKRNRGPASCSGEIPEATKKASVRGPGTSTTAPKFAVSESQLGHERVVDFAAHVDRTGYVCHVIIVQSSGLAELDRSALDAVARWRWRPAEIAGAAVESIEIERATFAIETRTAHDRTERAFADLMKAVTGK